MIQFIHVGKCAGSSVGTALQNLSIEFEEFHCGNASTQLAHSIKHNSEHFYLVTVRDPIARFVSAFYWDYYEKRVLNDYHGPDNKWKIYYERFETPNQIAEALTSRDSSLRELAWDYVTNSKLHAEFCISWYIPLAKVKCLHSKNCHVIRTEHSDRDFLAFLRKFNIDTTSFGGLPREKQNYKHKITNYDTHLSKVSIQNLKHVYFDDYLILDGFYRKGLINRYYKKLR